MWIHTELNLHTLGGMPLRVGHKLLTISRGRNFSSLHLVHNWPVNIIFS